MIDHKPEPKISDSATGELAVPGWTPMFSTPSQAPWKAAFRLDSLERANVAQSALRGVGIPAGRWPELPPEVDKKTSVEGALGETLKKHSLPSGTYAGWHQKSLEVDRPAFIFAQELEKGSRQRSRPGTRPRSPSQSRATIGPAKGGRGGDPFRLHDFSRSRR